MRRATLAAVLVAVAIVGGLQPVQAKRAPAPAPARVVDGRVDDWRGTSTGLGGTWQYDAGELVYQDHLFDDLGADTGQRAQNHALVSPPKGDVRYPSDEARFGHNAADLLELRLAVDGADLMILARMSTLKAEDTTVVALAFDTDEAPETGGGWWPHGAGLDVPGIDRVVTLWGTGGSVTSLPVGDPVALHGDDVAVEIDNAHNAIEARIPLVALGDPRRLRVWAASGLWDAATTTWTPIPSGSPTATTPGGGSNSVEARAFNLAFRDREEGSFLEDHQAAALASGDLSSFFAEVDLDLLRAGASVPYRIEPGRFYAAVVDEGFSVPPHHEGLSYEGTPGRFAGVGGAALAQTFDFYGRHQPYGIYLPSTYDGTTALPAALVLHGLGGSHSSFNSQPGFLADMGEGNGTAEEPPMMLITPLGRGSSFYADWGEADVLAVLGDAQARFPMDPERLYLTGYSMGGYGTYRFGSLYPDRFAAAATWAGYTGEFTGSYVTAPLGGGGARGKSTIGNPVDTLENFRHLPLAHLAGTNDEIVPTPGQYAAPRRLSELGYRSRLDLYPGYEHFSFAIVDDWKQVRSWLGDRRREATPRDITYRFSDGWTAPGLAAELGLVHDGAWWLQGLAMREPTEDALVLASASATSWAVPGAATTVERTTTPANEPTPHVQQLVSWSPGAALPTANRADVDLRGVATATIDLQGAGLRACGLTLAITTDGPTSIRLVGPMSRRVVVAGVAGMTGTRDRQSDALVILVPSAAVGEAVVRCL